MTRLGEVIESSTTCFTAGTYRLLEAPAFGSLVRAATRSPTLVIYGLVYEIRTGSIEPGGRAIVRGGVYGGRDLYDEDIYREHPDLAEVLQTEFSALTVGFVEGEHICHYLPPHPPPVHYSVYVCTAQETVAFTQTTDFFRTVLFSSYGISDELLAAMIRATAPHHPNPHAFLVQAGREVARLLKHDYDRLHSFLKRMRG